MRTAYVVKGHIDAEGTIATGPRMTPMYANHCFVDTSAWFALFVPHDPAHAQLREEFGRFT